MSSLTIDIGDVIWIGSEQHVVTGFDHRRDVVTTTGGAEVHYEDVCRVPAPLHDPAAIERWLAGPTWIAPPQIEVETVHWICPTGKDGCRCGCYTLITKADGLIAGEQHFSQNGTCTCARRD